MRPRAAASAAAGVAAGAAVGVAVMRVGVAAGVVAADEGAAGCGAVTTTAFNLWWLASHGLGVAVLDSDRILGLTCKQLGLFVVACMLLQASCGALRNAKRHNDLTVLRGVES